MNKFIKNKYLNWYNKLCFSRQQLNRVKFKAQYFEKHHIIPQSLGGNNENSNLVLLTAREHFIAHLLLTKFTTGKDHHKMLKAYTFMASKAKHRINSKIYETLKKEYSKSMSGENNPQFGKKGTRLGSIASYETRAKMSKAHSNRIRKPHSKETKQKMSESGKNKIFTKEHKINISKANSGKNHPLYGKLHSKETKQKMSESQVGKKHSIQTKNKISASLKGKPKPKIKCPHCDKQGAENTMKRWHFDNCKFLIT